MNQTHTRRLLLIVIVLVSLFLAACGGSQTPTTVKIGIVYASTTLEQLVDNIKVGMTAQGYEEGKTVTYLYDKPTSASSNSPEELTAQVQKLVQAQVDLIITVGTPATQAAKDATQGTTMPIVFVPIADPVQAGFVQSITHPGGNITGVATPPSLQGKRLEYLPTIVPNLKRIYIPYDAVDTSAEVYLNVIRETAAKLGIELVLQPVKTADEALAAINTIPEDVQAIFILPGGPLISNKSKELIAISLQKKLPLFVSSPAQVDQGALSAYNFNNEVVGKQAARLVIAILKGVKPADTPVESADFFLSLNLKTAKAIGLTISDSVLRYAETIIR
ncbi:MAG TPA: ABC transporter substrate-binding protein [Phototrophicaceae bacterium]|nr:ABC transporter substrate-binding protein [Phototrophicaceae bacterium]